MLTKTGVSAVVHFDGQGGTPLLISKATQLLTPYPIRPIIPPFIYYACRLIPYSNVATLVTKFPKEKRNDFRTLRAWFDHSTYKNDLYRACWLLSHEPRPNYQPTAQRFSLDPNTLKQLYQHLDPQDIATLKTRPKPMRYTTKAIETVMKSVAKWQRYLVKRRLYFCFANDRAVDQQDVFGELTRHGIHIIRRYEIYGYDTKVMTAFVAKGMDNYSKTLANRWGNPRHNPLLALDTRAKAKTLWYMNQRERIVEQCTICPDDTSKRKLKNNTLYYLVEFSHRKPTFVSSNLLYRDEDEADAALQAYCSGVWKRRNYLIDLTPDTIGDWIPMLRSLDAPDPTTQRPLHEIIPAPSANILRFDAAHVAKLSPNVQRFVETINGNWNDMLEAFCQEHYRGKSAAELSPARYVTAVRKFCGVTAAQVQKELAELNPFRD